MRESQRASDELLLRMIREGKHAAEIAVRFGVTTGELCERTADLRNRLGTERYQELTGSAPSQARCPRRRAFLWGMVLAAGVVSGLLVVANLLDRPAEEAPLARAPASEPTARVLHAPAQVVADGRTFEDLGPFLFSAGTRSQQIGTISNRAALATIELRGTSYLGGGDAIDWVVVSASRTDAFLRGTLPDRQIDLAVYTGRPGGRLRQLGSGIGPLLEVSGTPAQPLTLVVRATQGSQVLEARLTDDGTLLVATEPLARSSVIEEHTGASLDVSGARAFGTIPRTASGSTVNACDPNPSADEPDELTCRVAWLRSNRGYVVPVDGAYSCAGARSVSFVGDGIRLDFVLSGAGAASLACEPASVTAGTPIVPDGEWVIRAWAESGAELPVVVGLDGQVYVGAVRGNVDCPCLPQS